LAHERTGESGRGAIERSSDPTARGVLLTPWCLRWFQTSIVGVQLGRTGRKCNSRSLNVLRDHLGHVRGVAIEHEEHGAIATAHKALGSR
jgi:hypothetical protein